MDPGAEPASERIIDVPLRSGLDRVNVITYFGFTRGDKCTAGSSHPDSGEFSWETTSGDMRHTRDAPKWLAQPGDEFSRYHAEIHRSSEMLNLTHATEYANAWWVIPRWREGASFAKGDTQPFMDVEISLDPEGQVLSQSVNDSCGVALIARQAEATVDQFLKAARK
ncbi:hypothetical protein O1L44_22130 [Streptomyces noursei]|uniref:hypothetical protein n=1 Tax=Streptomyces noursei TaxID=1971 RepID=UPI0013520CF6|nr:hypothetical protein [Streptomyces noursei]